jgi:hypothetical protein
MILSASPFSKVLRQSFEAGIASGATWTLCIDADVIPTDRCVETLVTLAESLERPVFEVQGVVHDKLFGVSRPAGNHLYRTELLPDALNHIPVALDVLRPESAVIRTMSARGHPWWQDSAIVGLHDHGQFLRDIARKVMVQALKFERFSEFLKEHFLTLAPTDDDFKVALAALDAVARKNLVPVLDADAMSAPSDDLLRRLGLSERGPILDDELRAMETLLSKLPRHSHRTDLECQFAPRTGYL